MPAVLGIALDSHHLRSGVLNQFTQEHQEHQQQREEGCGYALLRAEKQNWLSQQSELSDQPFHLTAISLWVECDKLFFWQLSFNSWHCCLVVPAQLCYDYMPNE